MANIQAIIRYPTLVLCLILLSSCRFDPRDYLKGNSPTPTPPTTQVPAVTIQQILKANRLVALNQGNQIYVVDPEFAQPLPLYLLTKPETPVRTELNTFLVSPLNKFIVWYTPESGIIALNTELLQTKIIEPPSNWLNTNPYFEFKPNSTQLYFITQDGQVLNQVDLTTNQRQNWSIPYPFGTNFRLAPDGQKILYIAGYNPDNRQTNYLLSDLSGDTSRLFNGSTETAYRDLIQWLPDSSAVVSVHQNQLTKHPYTNPDQESIISEFSDGRITQLSKINQYIYLITEGNFWHVIDLNNTCEISRTSTAIASELNQPKFYPWSPQEMLISEKISDQPIQFERLWLSDLKGKKKLIMPKYAEIQLTTDTPDLP